MRYLGNPTSFFTMAVSLLFSVFLSAQSTANTPQKEGAVSIEQDAQLTRLLEMKKEINRKDEKRYRVQIYTGTLQGAQDANKEFKQKFADIKSDITFETPNYKVRAGKFRTRLEADRYLLEIKKQYPSAFLLAP